MTLQVMIGTTEGFTSSVGLRAEGGLTLLASGLHWKGRDEKIATIHQLLTLCHDLEARGVTVEGVAALEQVLLG